MAKVKGCVQNLRVSKDPKLSRTNSGASGGSGVQPYQKVRLRNLFVVSSKPNSQHHALNYRGSMDWNLEFGFINSIY